jgi:ABC-2 type transport system ATP-binding protein
MTGRGRVGAATALALIVVIGVLALTGGQDTTVEALEVRTAAGGPDPVTLDAALYVPETVSEAAPAPAILLAHGFLSDRSAVDGFARELASDGYVVLTWSARGFGASGGSIGLADPAREIADVSTLVDLLADRDEVLQDRDGDPRVAIVGASYGGGTALLAAAAEPRLDAVVAAAAWHDLAASLAPNGVIDGEPGVLARGWTSLLFTATGLMVPVEGGAGGPGPDLGARSEPPTPCGRFSDEVCDAYVEAAVRGFLPAAAGDVLDRASPAGRLDEVVAPTLLLQGQQDTLFDLAASRRNAAEIAAGGAPVRLRWVPGGHEVVGGGAPTGVMREEIDGWLDRWLDPAVHDRADPSPSSGDDGDDGDEDDGHDGRNIAFAWTDEASGVVRDDDRIPTTEPAGGGDLTWVLSADGRLVATGDGDQAASGSRSMRSPPGGEPAALSTLPGAGGLAGLLPSADIPGQHVSFDSPSVSAAVTLLGPPRLRLDLEGDGEEIRAFVKLYDVAPEGGATLIQRSVTPIRLTDTAGTVDLELADLAHRLAPDHRLRLTIATTDQAFANLIEPTVVTVATGPDASLLRVPTVPTPPAGGLSLAGAIAVVASTIVLLSAVLVVRRRRRPVGPATVGVADARPIEIRGLTKRYADGHLAVDDLDLTVEPGQVVGLLGPNGAGKTSTLRMLLGLSAPDGGTIQIFGHPMRPGHPVLHHVGALVEGPGFSPELSGRTNLQLYWRAGGRPLADADLPWALSIAELGEAIDKPVRTYSHGMKQRLAIAQALLGRPALLVLDEPTDGLDPEQIRAMRQLLARLGDEGHTVLVSSHLLAEVEQMCTHVVVVQRGRLRAAGAVAELVGSTQTVVIETDDRSAARDVLRAHLPDSDIEVSGAGLAVTLGTHDAADLVAWLVAAGQRVRAVTPRGTLEDAFLSLTGDQP